ncbi:unnamed protein product [Brugia timori]|uniref:START domain-containing protein n=1 Tax=Brugia timori TaxID=42155 RepID=A0A0R3QUR4_9BILA|nr:unnamed protein product [Brugia timori]
MLGETWYTGHLLYKCMKFGAYTILGCRTRKGRPMIISETYIDDFIVHQCFEENSKIYYRESLCDMPGQPLCGSFEENSSKIAIVALFDRINQTGNYPSVANLSQDWKIVNSYGTTIPLNRIEVINSYPLNLISTAKIRRKIKRQTDMSNDKMIKRYV